MLLCGAISGGVLGDIITSNNKNGILKMISVGGLIAMIAISSFYFGIISIKQTPLSAVKEFTVVFFSFLFFSLTIVNSVLGIIAGQDSE